MISTVFSVMFNIFNTLLMTFVFQNKKLKYTLVIIVYALQTIILVFTNFILDEMDKRSIEALVIAVVYTLILGPAFLFMTSAIMQETIDESNLSIA